MPEVKLLIIDVLKPHAPTILELGQAIAGVGKNLSTNLRILEMDEKTETVEIIIKGGNIDFEKIRKVIEGLGGSIHSIDEVSAGPELINSKNYMALEK